MGSCQVWPMECSAETSFSLLAPTSRTQSLDSELQVNDDISAGL